MSIDAPLTASVAASRAESRPWLRAFGWLALLGPFFFASYGFATWLTAQRGDVGSIVFDWERSIPFVAWTIVPYWLIDVLYGVSLFLCATRAELDHHGLRLLTAQLISVAGFLLFPLRFTFERPDVDGWLGALFAVLGSFDKPFNQAPSLHISLLVILWVLYASKTPRRWHVPLHIAFLLIGVSVLTTWQHHFIDVPTGIAVGMLCLWLWPGDREPPLRPFAFSADRRRRVLALRYAVGAMACAVVGSLLGGSLLWLWWVSLTLALVALIYAALGPHAFQKRDGPMTLAACSLLAPYLGGAWINSRAWTWGEAPSAHVADDVWIGRLPSAHDIAAQPVKTVVDLCCELPFSGSGVSYVGVPMLDLVVPDRASLASAVDAIERARSRGAGAEPSPVLVCCALGFSRSAMAVAAWLIATDRERDVESAIARVRAARPRIVLDDAHRATLATFVRAPESAG